jgi:DNA replication protein DnaC
MADSTVEDFFEIISKRYEKGSTIITSNRPVTQWDKVFIDRTLTSAIVDRLMHHCIVIEITGDSYRYKKRSA